MYLVETGADISIMDNQGHTALDYANSLGLVQLIESLQGENGGNADSFGNTPLHHACYNDQSETVRAILGKGTDGINARNDKKLTPLYIAVMRNNIMISELLLDAGADASISGSFGDSPLLAAAYNGNQYLVKKLLEYGADANWRNDAGETALIISAQRNDNYIAGILISNGADVTCADTEGHTALYYATENGSNDIVLKLLTAGAEN